MFLPGVRILIPNRAQWNGGVGIVQLHSDIPIFTDGSKVGEGTGAGVFCSKFNIELHFRLKDDCSVFQAKIFAILKTSGPASNSESYMIFVDS